MKSSLLAPKLALGALVLSALHAVTTASPAAAAAVRWASPTGTGDPTVCSQVAPCDLETAVEHASVQAGDEVVVTPGDYNVTTLSVDKAITLHGQAGQPRPKITTAGSVTVGAAATVRDLDLVHNTNGPGLWTNTAGAVVERVTSKMTAVGGFACAATATSTWRDSVCWATATNSRGMGSNAGFPASTRTITLRNVTAVGVAGGLSFDFNGTGINVIIDAKNVIASSPAADVRAAGDNGASVQITLTNSNYAEETELSTGGGFGSVTDPGSGTNQTAAPVFVEAANGDFRQAGGSPTIDAGVADPANGSADFEGDPRAARGTAACPELVDIGADERVTALECDPPDTSIASGPDASTTDATPTFGLASDETGVTFECRVDAGAFAPCATPFTTATLGLGAHTLQARATDPSGNVDETPATRSFTVVEPDTTLTGTPKKKVLTKKKRAKVTFAFTSTAAGGFECSLDGAAFKPCTSPLTFKAKLGKHTMQVRAVSDSGLVDPTPATYKFKVKRKS
ncbi:hypothetical protein [Nocardioides sp.]|uniref:hypothetical protein n=1 Tax=Nocardioides sp. TaxID=35761 RepID=UPI001A2BD001|nr:hypothetical protein [Nocardioides sp.]MBJ7355904.1 hypothetical protein [Nocardioides sp.]